MKIAHALFAGRRSNHMDLASGNMVQSQGDPGAGRPDRPRVVENNQRPQDRVTRATGAKPMSKTTKKESI